MYIVIRETTRRAHRLGMERGEYAPDKAFGPFITKKEATQFRARMRTGRTLYTNSAEYWVLRITEVEA